jgi:hypothetical protein
LVDGALVVIWPMNKDSVVRMRFFVSGYRWSDHGPKHPVQFQFYRVGQKDEGVTKKMKFFLCALRTRQAVR